jgi:hypothetical protein
MATTIRPTLQGLHNPNEMQPLQGWWSIQSLPCAVPTAIEFVPFGDEIGRGLSFDTLLPTELEVLAGASGNKAL